MNGFERRKEQKKEKVRRAALELFGTYGFKKVSVNDIANKAGVSPVTIYNHFHSKDDLIRDVVKTQFDNMLKKYHEIIYGEGAFPEKLGAIVFDKSKIAGQFHGELAQTLFQDEPEMQQYVESMWQGDVVAMTLELLEQGRQEGYVNAQISQEILMMYLKVVSDGFAANPELIAATAQNPESVRELNQILLYGMLGSKEPLEPI